MKIVLLGPPGSGKGTQANLICEKYNIPHISTGDIFRYNISNKTPLGLQAQEYINKGSLVPDELTISIVKDRLKDADCKKGFVLDGFPRNLSQAQALDEMVKIDKAILVYLDDEEIIKRLSRRRMCRKCGNPTNLSFLVDGKCEKCGGEVFIRDDDKPEVVQNRLIKQRLPENLADFYKEKGVFEKVDSSSSMEKTFNQIENILKQINN